jgi:hypothetical protein
MPRMASIRPDKKTNTSISIDAAIHKGGQRIAKEQRRNFSSYVENLIWEDIKRHDDLRILAAAKASRRA